MTEGSITTHRAQVPRGAASCGCGSGWVRVFVLCRVRGAGLLVCVARGCSCGALCAGAVPCQSACLACCVMHTIFQLRARMQPPNNAVIAITRTRTRQPRSSRARTATRRCRFAARTHTQTQTQTHTDTHTHTYTHTTTHTQPRTDAHTPTHTHTHTRTHAHTHAQKLHTCDSLQNLCNVHKAMQKFRPGCRRPRRTTRSQTHYGQFCIVPRTAVADTCQPHYAL